MVKNIALVTTWYLSYSYLFWKSLYQKVFGILHFKLDRKKRKQNCVLRGGGNGVGPPPPIMPMSRCPGSRNQADKWPEVPILPHSSWWINIENWCAPGGLQTSHKQLQTNHIQLQTSHKQLQRVINNSSRDLNNSRRVLNNSRRVINNSRRVKNNSRRVINNSRRVINNFRRS